MRCFRPGIFVFGIMILLSGCSAKQEESTSQFFAMDTVMSISAYGENSSQAVESAVAIIYELEDMLSVTDPGSEIWAVNNAQGQWVTVSDYTLEVVQLALQLAEETGGTMDPTIYPAMTEWGFTTGDYQVPDGDTIKDILTLVDYTAVEVDEAQSAIRVPQGVQLDLGAVAKGYASDLLAELLADMDYAILNLGGNAYVVGEKPDGDPWRVGVQDPEGDGYLAVVSPTQGAVITSGGYQRYFQEGDTTYWHILDPHTGVPAQSDLVSVTVLGESGLTCDGLSTALFVMGEQGAIAYWRAHQDFDLVLMNREGTILVTKSLYDRFALVDGVEAQVEVIAP